MKAGRHKQTSVRLKTGASKMSARTEDVTIGTIEQERLVSSIGLEVGLASLNNKS